MVVEQAEQDLDGLTSGVDLWVVGADELALEAFAVIADLAEPLADLFLGPFRVADEVKVAVLLPIQLISRRNCRSSCLTARPVGGTEWRARGRGRRSRGRSRPV